MLGNECSVGSSVPLIRPLPLSLRQGPRGYRKSIIQIHESFSFPSDDPVAELVLLMHYVYIIIARLLFLYCHRLQH